MVFIYSLHYYGYQYYWNTLSHEVQSGLDRHRFGLGIKLLITTGLSGKGFVMAFAAKSHADFQVEAIKGATTVDRKGINLYPFSTISSSLKCSKNLYNL